jgi:chemotaxis protein methyltransferase CheR
MQQGDGAAHAPGRPPAAGAPPAMPDGGRGDTPAPVPRRPPTAREPVVVAALSSLPLSHGDLEPEHAAQLQALKRQVSDKVGFACEGYKERCLRRRIAVRMRACGVHTYDDYARVLAGDAAEYERLVDALTINVSKFFRNPEVWDVVGERVLPELYGMNLPVVRAWSAGTAGGEEAYTMGMIAHDYAKERDIEDRVRILGTDIDRDSLAVAGRGEYTEFAMTDIDPALRDRWFDHGTSYRVRPRARTHVRFETLDLIRDEYPQEQHVIFCRNVIIYFERAVQEDLFHRFHDALVPGGFLVLGKVEALFGAAAGLFRTVANRERVFRKP